MAKTLQKLLTASAPPAEGGAPVFRITSPALDRDRDRVLGIQAPGSEFKTVLLWNHDSWAPAIGSARIYQEGADWVAALTFDGLDEMSRVVGEKVKAGTLDSCSIRFLPVAGHDPVANAEGGWDYPLVEVVELSVVNIPANAAAVRLRSLGGRKSARPVRGNAYKLLAEVLRELAEEPGDETETETAASEDAKAEPESPNEEAAPTPQTFASSMLAHMQEAARMADAFLGSGAEDEVLVALAEDIRDGSQLSVLQEWIAESEESPEEEASETPEEEASEPEAKGDEPAADSAGEEEPPEDVAHTEDAPSDEEVKALRRRVAKTFGFSVLQVSALSIRDLRSYDALR
ncbi:primosomal replication protein N [Corallococcus sp. H22C18031201]|nr:primosomal replication protein N [Corallococcus sp. H22C18031201]